MRRSVRFQHVPPVPSIVRSSPLPCTLRFLIRATFQTPMAFGLFDFPRFEWPPSGDKDGVTQDAQTWCVLGNSNAQIVISTKCASCCCSGIEIVLWPSV